MSRLLGRTGMNVIGRVMGLILAAVAMQFVLDGLREWWLLLPPHG
jgi:multiple antibiotic resistance protein